MDTRTINILSLCSGVGGLDLGVKLALPTSRTICYVEVEAYCCEVLATRMEEQILDSAPIWTDLKRFNGLPWRGVVDCIIGGYPCQPFSLAGRRAGTDDPRHLWPHIARIIKETAPSFCFFENVPGHLTLGFDIVKRELEEMGYDVTPKLVSAEEVGASHKRERLFILATRREVANSSIARSQRYEPETISGTWRRKEGGAVSELCKALFPPGPADLDAWRRILYEHPVVAPAISEAKAKAESKLRGLADGMANRVDRLRAGGNGAVPVVAAYALCLAIADTQREQAIPRENEELAA